MSDVKTTEAPVVEDEAAVTPAPPVRMMDHSNKWNVDGLRAARSVKDGEEVLCTATKTPLYYTREGGGEVMLASHGDCYNCGHIFHTSYLASSNDGKDSYPIRYVGRWCIDCQKLAPEDWEETPEDWDKWARLG